MTTEELEKQYHELGKQLKRQQRMDNLPHLLKETMGFLTDYGHTLDDEARKPIGVVIYQLSHILEDITK